MSLSSSRPKRSWIVPPSLPVPGTGLVHLHGHQPAALTPRLLDLLLATPVGAAVPDEAGEEPDDSGQADADQQWVLEGVQHWQGERGEQREAGEGSQRGSPREAHRLPAPPG